VASTALPQSSVNALLKTPKFQPYFSHRDSGPRWSLSGRLTLFRESVPKLDGQSLAPPVVLSDEPDVVEHIVDLMELTIRMQAEQLTVMMESWVRPD